MLSRIALKIFHETLLRIDARETVRRAIRVEGARLEIIDDGFAIALSNAPLYVISIGKAAFPMAAGFGEIAGEWIKGGVISGVSAATLPPGQPNGSFEKYDFDSRWKIFYGGHPLPNDESLKAARACFDLLAEADARKALVVFLISGGGSAMIEMPRDTKITLPDLRALNQILITSGAAIAEINAVRRAVSLVKGGGLARRAPRAAQISLIISDTACGDFSSVASGPSLAPPVNDGFDPVAVLEKYNLRGQLPVSVLDVLKNDFPIAAANSGGAETSKIDSNNRAYVLLDNENMLRRAAAEAEKMGFAVCLDKDDSLIAEGCERLLSRFMEFRGSVPAGRPVCLISGGEFGCRVTGNGFGGRNSETVLRLALLAREKGLAFDYAFLSAGTDGIDGNSPAAGAVADHRLIERAVRRGMNPRDFLENSDSFSFFEALGGAIMTGATGTNVRDLRLLVAN